MPACLSPSFRCNLLVGGGVSHNASTLTSLAQHRGASVAVCQLLARVRGALERRPVCIDDSNAACCIVAPLRLTSGEPTERVESRIWSGVPTHVVSQNRPHHTRLLCPHAHVPRAKHRTPWPPLTGDHSTKLPTTKVETGRIRFI